MNNVELTERKIIGLVCRKDNDMYRLTIRMDKNYGPDNLLLCFFNLPVRDCLNGFPEIAETWKRITFLQYNESHNILVMVDDGTIGNAVVLKRKIGSPGQRL